MNIYKNENERIAYLKFLNDEKPKASTGIHGGLTLGYGRLDDNGFWEFPLPIDCWTKEQLKMA